MSVSQDTIADTAEPSRTEREPTTIVLSNSVVELEDGPAGTIAAIHRVGRGVEYAGPLPDATIDALREVSA
jgi:hypothetical protein